MRDVFAIAVIFFVLAGLGLFEVPNDDAVIEAGIRAQAQGILADHPHALELTVAGREISVTGRVDSQAQRRALESRLRAIDGVEAVSGAFEVLPAVDRFEFRMTKSNDGTMRAGGHVLRGATSVQVAQLAAVERVPLTVATGAPDDAWDDVIKILTSVVVALDTAEVSLSGHDGQVRGVATWPAQAERAQALLAGLPEAYKVAAQIDVLDDGRPFLFMAELHPRLGLTLRGKIPPSLGRAPLLAALGQPSRDLVQVAPADPDLPGFAGAVQTGARLLAQAGAGQVLVTGDSVLLSGARATPALVQAVAAARAELGDGYQLDTSLLPDEPDLPFGLRIEKAATGVTLSGFLPQGDATTALLQAMAADDSALRLSVYPDLDGVAEAARVAAEAMGLAENGVAVVSEGELTLDVVLRDPNVQTRFATVLNGLPAGFHATRYVELLDDGSSPRARFLYDAVAGLRVEGKLPTGLDTPALQELTGVSVLDNRALTAFDGQIDGLSDRLKAVAAWLPDAERVRIDASAEGLEIAGVLSPGVDRDLIANETRALLQEGDQLTLTMMDAFPEEGLQRVNAASGQPQVFVAGYWLPVLDFDPAPKACEDKTAEGLVRDRVQFLSGSTRLDARAVRAVNWMSAVGLVCVNEGRLQLEIGGHTDNVGGASANRQISEARARQVAEAIFLRGVIPDFVQIRGYGESRPVADNATEDGRAANRRITFDWTIDMPQPEAATEGPETGAGMVPPEGPGALPAPDAAPILPALPLRPDIPQTAMNDPDIAGPG
ncbi:OmpA family protein [Mesobacterium sp. TK19101]|uniref:OmpA family protein n=1 Tax=Mesobacterium hydrothermale TaxID=3111907 RepID=A0ABU6HCK7_9RHOB|nr:OmpA family protein [Mesobacterium sp. TK19101]MEC3859857.1 OmpA family protein [Mesobacterium sp. TK19101]